MRIVWVQKQTLIRVRYLLTVGHSFSILKISKISISVG